MAETPEKPESTLYSPEQMAELEKKEDQARVGGQELRKQLLEAQRLADLVLAKSQAKKLERESEIFTPAKELEGDAFLRDLPNQKPFEKRPELELGEFLGIRELLGIKKKASIEEIRKALRSFDPENKRGILTNEQIEKVEQLRDRVLTVFYGNGKREDNTNEEANIIIDQILEEEKAEKNEWLEDQKRRSIKTQEIIINILEEISKGWENEGPGGLGSSAILTTPKELPLPEAGELSGVKDEALSEHESEITPNAALREYRDAQENVRRSVKPKKDSIHIERPQEKFGEEILDESEKKEESPALNNTELLGVEGLKINEILGVGEDAPNEEIYAALKAVIKNLKNIKNQLKNPEVIDDTNFLIKQIAEIKQKLYRQRKRKSFVVLMDIQEERALRAGVAIIKKVQSENSANGEIQPNSGENANHSTSSKNEEAGLDVPDYYAALGVNSDISQAELVEIARQYATKKLNERNPAISNALNVLLNPQERKKYDQKMVMVQLRPTEQNTEQLETLEKQLEELRRQFNELIDTIKNTCESYGDFFGSPNNRWNATVLEAIAYFAEIIHSFGSVKEIAAQELDAIQNPAEKVQALKSLISKYQNLPQYYKEKFDEFKASALTEKPETGGGEKEKTVFPESMSLLDYIVELKDKKGWQKELGEFFNRMAGNKTYRFKNGQKQYLKLRLELKIKANENAQDIAEKELIFDVYDEAGEPLGETREAIKGIKYREFKKPDKPPAEEAVFRADNGKYTKVKIEKSANAYVLESMVEEGKVLASLPDDQLRQYEDENGNVAYAKKSKPLKMQGKKSVDKSKSELDLTQSEEKNELSVEEKTILQDTIKRYRDLLISLINRCQSFGREFVKQEEDSDIAKGAAKRFGSELRVSLKKTNSIAALIEEIEASPKEFSEKIRQIEKNIEDNKKILEQYSEMADSFREAINRELKEKAKRAADSAFEINLSEPEKGGEEPSSFNPREKKPMKPGEQTSKEKYKSVIANKFQELSSEEKKEYGGEEKYAEKLEERRSELNEELQEYGMLISEESYYKMMGQGYNPEEIEIVDDDESITKRGVITGSLTLGLGAAGVVVTFPFGFGVLGGAIGASLGLALSNADKLIGKEWADKITDKLLGKLYRGIRIPIESFKGKKVVTMSREDFKAIVDEMAGEVTKLEGEQKENEPDVGKSRTEDNKPGAGLEGEKTETKDRSFLQEQIKGDMGHLIEVILLELGKNADMVQIENVLNKYINEYGGIVGKSARIEMVKILLERSRELQKEVVNRKAKYSVNAFYGGRGFRAKVNRLVNSPENLKRESKESTLNEKQKGWNEKLEKLGLVGRKYECTMCHDRFVLQRFEEGKVYAEGHYSCDECPSCTNNVTEAELISFKNIIGEKN